MEVRALKVFEHNGVSWIMRETHYSEGELANQSLVEIYDPMDLGEPPFQTFFVTSSLDNPRYEKALNEYLTEVKQDIYRMFA